MKALRIGLLAAAVVLSAGRLYAEPANFLAGWVHGATLQSVPSMLGNNVTFSFGNLQMTYVNTSFVPSFTGNVVPANTTMSTIVEVPIPGFSSGMGPFLGPDGLFYFGLNQTASNGVTLNLPDGVATFNVHFGTAGVQTNVPPATWAAISTPYPGAEVGPNSITVLGEVELVSNTSSMDLSQFLGPDGGLIAITFFSDDPTLNVMDLLLNGGAFQGDGAVQFIALGGGITNTQIPEPAAVLLWSGLGLGVWATRLWGRRKTEVPTAAA